MTTLPVLKARRRILTGLLPVLLSLTAGCTLDSPTYYAQKKVEIVAQEQHYEMDAKKLDRQAARRIAADYARYGDGSVKITVTYDPKDSGNTAMMATDSAARIASLLRAEGVNAVESEILPVSGAGASTVLLSYDGYVARAPEGCDDFATIDDTAHENYRDYELGCSTETYIARQIARPKDLLGRDAITEETDARKRANAVEGYKWTVRNDILETPETNK